MSRAYTEEDLSDQFDTDLAWRVKELSDLKLAIKSSGSGSANVLLRALVTLVYAHWEGYVRFCARKYFEYITLRKHPYSELERQIYINSFLSRIDSFFASRQGLKERCAFINDVLDSRSKRFSAVNPLLVDTKSNLSSWVLEEICTVCGIDFAHFEPKRTFIDTIILKRRNSIAHGEEQFVNPDEVDDIVAEMIALMRSFRNQLENKIYTKSYKAA